MIRARALKGLHQPPQGLPQAALERLQDDLRVESAELERLEDAIQRERAALAAGLGDAIADIANEKERHARALAQLAERRRATLELNGRRLRMDELVETGAAGEPLRAAWHALREQARRVDAANKVNGGLIASHLHLVQGRLSALVAAADPAATYGPGAHRIPGRALGAA